MSKGNRIVPVRISAEMMSAIEASIESLNVRAGPNHWNVSDWIRQAILDKLAHMQRSRRPRRRQDSGGSSTIIVVTDPIA